MDVGIKNMVNEQRRFFVEEDDGGGGRNDWPCAVMKDLGVLGKSAEDSWAARKRRGHAMPYLNL